MRSGFDKEYATSYRGEVAYLKEQGIRYTFVKTIGDTSIYKYEKTPELFSALESFYLQVKRIKENTDETINTRGVCKEGRRA